MPDGIRKMTPDDIDGVYKIEAACFTREAWFREDFEDLAECTDGGVFTTLVYIFSGRVGGYICGSCVEGDMEISSVAVDKALRRRGIARALIVELERLRTPDTAFLEVRESNVAAKKLYLSLGFEPYGIRRGYYSNPEEDAVLMRKIYGKK